LQYQRSLKFGLFVDLQHGIGCAGLQGSSEAEGLAEVVRGGGARAAPPPVDEEGH